MDNFFSLDKGIENKKYRVVDIGGSEKIKRRMLDLGFVDCDVMIIKRSALKGVYLIQIRNFILALKRKEVANVLVKKYE